MISKRSHCAGLLAAVLLTVGNMGPAVAQKCKDDGGLIYLGNTRDGSESVWLSATIPGAFELEAAQGNTTVDTWSRARRGLHLSLSPFVSSGNGGVHRLFNTGLGGQPCLIDTQNQMRNFPFPPIPPGPGPFPPIPPGPRPGPFPPLPPGPGPFPPGPGPGPGPSPVPPGPSVLPGATLPSVGARIVRTQSGALCIDPRTPRSAADRDRDLPVCPQEVLAEIDARGGIGPAAAPLTPGRDLGPPTLWNIWTEARAVDISDERYGLDMGTTLASATFGVDRRMGKYAALGVSFAVNDSDTGGFNDFLKVGATGFNIGPYMALRLSDHWVANTSLTYGLYDSDIELVVLSGDYTSQTYGSAVDLYGQYRAGEYFIRPKLSVNYSHTVNDSFDLSGTIFNRHIAVRFADDSFDYGRLEATTEFSRFFSFSNGTAMMPFIEVGALYEFERPNDGKILAGDLSLVTPSPWAGSLRTGVRMITRNALQLEASAGYLSFGQNGLDAWEGKLQLSYGF